MAVLPTQTVLSSTYTKSAILKTGTLVTTTTIADQVVLTYTVTSGKTFYLEHLHMEGAQTLPAGGTSLVLGTISLETPAGSKGISKRCLGGGSVLAAEFKATYSEPVPIYGGTVIRVVVTPALVTSFTWTANFGGYEK
jgi:hypothetical protein